jgi:protocatechuate 3,4-dioxygenase beta subunit
MKQVFIASLVCLFATNCNSQQPDKDLIKQAEKMLVTKSVSDILTDPTFNSIHPDPVFRKLIEKNASASVLKITDKAEPGKKIKVLGVITDPSGKPVPDALVYMYQTDAKGWYAAERPHVGGNEGDTRQARIFGYVRTDKEGKFELHTIKPSGYPQSDLPAHIHVHVWKDGFKNLVNEFLFDDDERLVGEIRKSSENYHLMISKPEPASAGFDQQFSYRLVLIK